MRSKERIFVYKFKKMITILTNGDRISIDISAYKWYTLGIKIQAYRL